MLKFFKNPFAIIGTRAAIPAADPGTGEVSYPTGFGPQYQLPKTDPTSRNIPRDQTNQLYFDLTNELALIQAHGVPDFITSALNEGVAKEYSIGDRVRYDDGTATRVYESRTNANTALPTVAASWRLVQTGTPIATAGGTANALTAAFVPSLYSLQNGLLFLIEHTAVNTGAATLAVDGGAALPVVKLNDVPLAAGDIPGANSWGLYVFDASLAKYVLLTTSGGLPAASNAEAQAVALTTKAVTPANLGATVLGYGQTWQNVTGSRALSTTYTNTTGRPIVVSAAMTMGASANGDLTVSGAIICQFASTAAGTHRSCYSAIIPPGATYSLAGGVLAFWFELR